MKRFITLLYCLLLATDTLSAQSHLEFKGIPIHKHQDATARQQRRCVRSALDMVTTAIELKR